MNKNSHNFVTAQSQQWLLYPKYGPMQTQIAIATFESVIIINLEIVQSLNVEIAQEHLRLSPSLYPHIIYTCFSNPWSVVQAACAVLGLHASS